MPKNISLSQMLKLYLCSLGFIFAIDKTSAVQAQITSDDTTGTQVTNNGGTAEITGGETRGENLFHSFEDFSVPTNSEAFFDNANDIGNIFSRVTGGNISNIDGLIRANGSANLFLINPAGIMFGESASLNLGGSFYGSTADSILFENGEFSTTNLDNPPLLTVNAPIGFSFRDNPGNINSNGARLRVRSVQTLALIGGNLNFDDGSIQAFDSNIELGGLTESGTVDLNEDGSLSFPASIAKGDISFNSGTIFVAGENGGTLDINAQNLSLNSESRIFAGISIDSGSPEAQAGDVVINLTKDFTLDRSLISNSNLGTGNAGNILINARNVSLVNDGIIANTNNGAGNVGNIVIIATENILLDATQGSRASSISNAFDLQATGNIGEINLTAQNLDLLNGGTVTSAVLADNDSGDINLSISDTLRIDGFKIIAAPDGIVNDFSSSVDSQVVNGVGNSGDININAQNLLLNNQGTISAANTGQGSSGDININVGSIEITERGRINGGVGGSGNGSNININAEEKVSVIGNDEFRSFIFADVAPNATGQAGNIEINTPQLIVQDAFISADVGGDGEGGTIDISATDSIELSNVSFISADVGGDGEGGTIDISATDSIELSNASFISADVFPNSTGNGGNLNIEAGQLALNDGSQVSAATLGNGNAGNVTIIADNIDLSGVGERSRSGIFASALTEDGNGGNINLTTEQLTISNGAAVIAGNFSSLGTSEPGTGEPGNITISADTLDLISEGRIEARTQAETGTGANINLEVADSISLKGSSFISAEALGDANGGNLNIDTNFIVAFPEGNNDIIASAAQGQGGNINITAESLLGIRERPLNSFTNDINASSEFGLDGTILITTPDLNPLQGATELPIGVVQTEETVAQICSANAEEANGLTIGGKGGVPPAPDLPLSSTDIIDRNSNSATVLPEPLKTSQGEVQPARGVKVTESGDITLTAYRTDNNGDRATVQQSSCG